MSTNPEYDLFGIGSPTDVGGGPSGGIGDFIGGLFDGGSPVNPMALLGGMPSFSAKGGDGGSAYSSSSQTAIQASAFTVGPSASSQSVTWGVVGLVCVVAIWALTKKRR